MSRKHDELPDPPKQLGNYSIIKRIGRGGMGEILLAHDPLFGRKIAIKRMLPYLFKSELGMRRFHNEVKIASKLQHPSIISIYTLHESKDERYYTMPYLEGQTLSELIRETRSYEKKGSLIHPIGSSIPELMHIFLQICQAVEFTHAQGFLHRDIKPDNIIIGRFGEAILLDWGLACPINQEGCGDKEFFAENVDLTGLDMTQTRPGKAAGSVPFMAPEAAVLGETSIQTDIYALGIILYYLLSLRLPFIRISIQDFIKTMKMEKWIDPQDVAPHREIPALLSAITKKCIHPLPKRRFQSVSDLIKVLKDYIEGNPQWAKTKEIKTENKKDWIFEENVPLTKHLAISANKPLIDWVHIMVSKASFSDILKFETTITPTKNSLGVGFLFCLPDTHQIHKLGEGFLLWIGSSDSPSCKIFRNSVEILTAPLPTFKESGSHHVVIELKDNQVLLEIDEQKILSYYSHLPLIGGHIGVMRKDMNLNLDTINIYEGSQNVMVNCLAIPDAFFIHKDFNRALFEYRKIAQSFQGRFEGREAIFRAGLTLLEKAKSKSDLFAGETLYDEAIAEFNKLHNTPGAPLEYLGKALTYQNKESFDEEVKCLEFAARKFSKHPLRKHLKEHANLRFHQVSKENRKLATMFALLILDHLPLLIENQDTYALLLHLQKQGMAFPYFSYDDDSIDKLNPLLLSIQLSSFLDKPISLFELTQKHTAQLTSNYQALESICFTLLDMNYPKLIEFMLKHFRLSETDYFFNELKQDITTLLALDQEGLIKTVEALCPQGKLNDKSSSQKKGLIYLIDQSLYLSRAQAAPPLFKSINSPCINHLKLWLALLNRNSHEATELLKHVDNKLFTDITSPYYFLYGCFLGLTEGKRSAMNHFSISLEIASPVFYCLLSYYLNKKISLKSAWYETAFSYEKIALFRQLTLFYTCLNKKRKALFFEEKAKKERKNVQIPLNFLSDSL